MPMTEKIGIRAMGYWLPQRAFTMEELAAQNLLTSSPELLRSFGFDRAHIASASETQDVVLRQLLGSLFTEYGIDPTEIEVVLLSGAFLQEEAGENSFNQSSEPLGLFRYSAAKVQYELGMSRAVAVQIGQQGCAAFMSALRFGVSLLRAGEAANVLCVSIDILPVGTKREVIYNVLSDGAAAALLTKGHESLEPLFFKQVTKGYYWDTPKRRNEIIAAYFPTAVRVIEELLIEAGLAKNDIELFIPHNVNRKSWEILLELLGVPREKAFLDNIAPHAHSIGADMVLNLKDALSIRSVPRGSRILLFNFGFGANWSAALLRA